MGVAEGSLWSERLENGPQNSGSTGLGWLAPKGPVIRVSTSPGPERLVKGEKGMAKALA